MQTVKLKKKKILKYNEFLIIFKQELLRRF